MTQFRMATFSHLNDEGAKKNASAGGKSVLHIPYVDPLGLDSLRI